MNLADNSHWERKTGKTGDYSSYKILFHDVIKRFFRANPAWEFFEVGCAPGRNLVYFHHFFKFRPAGIDYIRNFDIVEANLRRHGIEDFNLYNEDFLKFVPPKQYDVVGNFGFIEHFTEWYNVLYKILDLTKAGGYLITSVPHFRYGQYFLRRLLTPQVFEYHNLDVMDKKKLERCLREMGVELIYSNYFLTFAFWGDKPEMSYKKVIYRIVMYLSRISKKLPLSVPNRFFSPQLLIIGKKH